MFATIELIMVINKLFLVVTIFFLTVRIKV